MFAKLEMGIRRRVSAEIKMAVAFNTVIRSTNLSEEITKSIYNILLVLTLIFGNVARVW